MSDKRKTIGAFVLLIAALGVLVSLLYKNFAPEDTPADSWTLMDVETGKLYQVPVAELRAYPMENPDTGKNTLYPTEVCYWSEQCRKVGGTRVILHEVMGQSGPTHCPTCGHIVRQGNPLPPDFRPNRD